MKKRSGSKPLPAIQGAEQIIGLAEHNGFLYCTSDKGVYKLVNNKWELVILNEKIHGLGFAVTHV